MLQVGLNGAHHRAHGQSARRARLHQPDGAYFELAGEADHGLTVIVVSRVSVAKTGMLRKRDPYSGDYYGEAGWLQIREELRSTK